jgi:hypothetical protein
VEQSLRQSNGKVSDDFTIFGIKFWDQMKNEDDEMFLF